MLKKLRRKIVLINMILVGIVLLALFSVVCINTYHQQYDRVEGSLSEALRKPAFDAGSLFDPGQILNKLLPGQGDTSGEESGDDEYGSGEKRFVTTSVVSIYSGSATYTVSSNSLNLSSAQLDAAVAYVLAKNKQEGNISKQELRYRTSTEDDVLKIAFADTSEAREAVKKTIFISGFLTVCGLVIVFFISLLLSGLAIRPVKRSWRQQHQFVADASHELKTPLTVILANNNIIMSHKDDTVESQEKWLNSTKEEAEHMSKLVGDLLFLAKSDGEQSPVVFSEVDLSDICENVSLQFDPVAFEKGLNLTCDVQPGITMQGDGTQLNQLVRIFLDNACKYTPEGGDITLRLAKNGPQTIMSVTNTGDPIPKESLEHLFERFYRVDEARTRTSSEGGYGLGLAIAKTITERHGGTVSVESTAEKGTVFTVTFKV
ncbi:MAG: HAMP domain-containing sensor histidine kinase [Bacillota bacterium]|nr:HAMP domain-containing sensor histidine kinase [Bacillota bacterium]